MQHAAHHLESVLEVVGGGGVLDLLGFPASGDGRFLIRQELYSSQPRLLRLRNRPFWDLTLPFIFVALAGRRTARCVALLAVFVRLSGVESYPLRSYIFSIHPSAAL